MFLLLPLMLMTGILTIFMMCFVMALYGVELISLMGLIRNCRQEVSRQSLQRLVGWVIVDHLLSCCSALFVITVLATADVTSSLKDWLPVLSQGIPEDELQTHSIVMGTMCATLFVIWAVMAVLLRYIAKSLDPAVDDYRQRYWGKCVDAIGGFGYVLNVAFCGILLLLFFPLTRYVSHTSRLRTQGALLWTLGLAIRQKLPLGREVLQLSDSYWGKQRYRLILLAENLNSGMSLAMALERQPGLVPRSVVMLIRMGEETGTTEAAIELATQAFLRRRERQSELLAFQQFGGLLLLPMIVIPNLVSFLMYYIVPKFKKIFEDFGVELPAVTILMIKLSDVMAHWAPLFVLAGLGGFVLLTLLACRDWELDWPFLDRLAPHLNSPPILRALALVIRAERSIPDALRGMMMTHPRETVRVRLARINRALEVGADLIQELVRERLIRRRDVELLRSAERVQNLPWCMEQLAGCMEDRVWHRIMVAISVACPALILLTGGVVLFFSTGFYMPLVKLLNELS